jgi:hypothetical protein
MRGLLLVTLLSCACAKKHAGVSEASPQEVADWLKAGAATVFDANNESFRQNNGVVAGAVLLDNYRTFDLSVLGTDKARQLVFYCSNKL